MPGRTIPAALKMLRTTLQLGFTKGAMLFAAALEHKWALTNLALGEACNYIGGLQDAAQGIWNKVRVGRAVGRGVRDKAVKAAGGTGNGVDHPPKSPPKTDGLGVLPGKPP